MRGGAAVSFHRHCEEQSDEAIQRHARGSGLLRFARNDGFGIICAALLISATALAAPRKIDDCEAIKEPNAYNLCLASFGPMRGQHGASYPGVASEGEKGGEGKSRAPAGAGRQATAARDFGGTALHRSGGRVRMEFTPGRR
ncbi:hypothetical protein [Methylocystis parvus]|uniref:Uncharacterized protein n=1 Tax=Methylocystis parvus TaxID=134 RepID=A0A6B8M6D6_9HYPH|nr:hypothetical protein [Methylocystis parvus]QGM98028.1 hypothetical protein F7D14_11435 [Methylocystis parvus]WBK01656.1 hypothetical protein MMG94_08140 [Methylocystis parvus OBBP]